MSCFTFAPALTFQTLIIRDLRCGGALWYRMRARRPHSEQQSHNKRALSGVWEEENVERQDRSPLHGRSLRGFVIGLVAVLTIGIVVLNLRGATRAGRADPNNARQVALGQEVYAVRCAGCHGANLEGQPNWKDGSLNGPRSAPPHDATGHTWHHADKLLFDIIQRGGQASSPPEYQNTMPAFGGILSDDEIWAVLAYLKRSWPPDIRAAQEQVNQQAR